MTAPRGKAPARDGARAQPRSMSIGDGCCSVAPRWPQRVHLALRRSASLEVSAPHRMISGANAIGALRRHFQFMQFTQTHGVPARN